MSDVHSVLAQLHWDTAHVNGIRRTGNWTEKWKIKCVRSANRTGNSSGNTLFPVVRSKLLLLGSMSLMRKWKFLLKTLASQGRCLHALVYRAGNESRLAGWGTSACQQAQFHMHCPQDCHKQCCRTGHRSCAIFTSAVWASSRNVSFVCCQPEPFWEGPGCLPWAGWTGECLALSKHPQRGRPGQKCVSSLERKCPTGVCSQCAGVHARNGILSRGVRLWRAVFIYLTIGMMSFIEEGKGGFADSQILVEFAPSKWRENWKWVSTTTRFSFFSHCGLSSCYQGKKKKETTWASVPQNLLRLWKQWKGSWATKQLFVYCWSPGLCCAIFLGVSLQVLEVNSEI